ncbi:MAG: hypothetical protein AAGF30_13035 [Pseudomonadota bacterium]
MSELTRHPPITLHLGAHRTGTASLQHLLATNADPLRDQGVVVWGPERTRSKLMAGVMGDPGRAGGRPDAKAARSAGRVSLRRSDLARDDVARLIISDANLLGGLRENVLLGRLYPSVQARLRRLRGAVPGVDRIWISIRSPDTWWASAFAFQMNRGFAPPDRATLEAVMRGRRTWRRVIEDVAAAFPEAELTVWSSEDWADDLGLLFALLTGVVPDGAKMPVLNATPSVMALRARLWEEGWVGTLPGLGDRYAPFDPDARADLRAIHAEDVAWLRGGAGGIATYHDPGARPAPRPEKGLRDERCRPSSPQMGTAG